MGKNSLAFPPCQPLSLSLSLSLCLSLSLTHTHTHTHTHPHTQRHTHNAEAVREALPGLTWGMNLAVRPLDVHRGLVDGGGGGGGRCSGGVRLLWDDVWFRVGCRVGSTHDGQPCSPQRVGGLAALQHRCQDWLDHAPRAAGAHHLALCLDDVTVGRADLPNGFCLTAGRLLWDAHGRSCAHALQ
jgi:hypothetical protein